MSNITWQCVRETQREFARIREEPETQALAKTLCTDENATLAIVTTSQENDAVISIIDSEAEGWIGVEDPIDIGGNEPGRFFYVDRTVVDRSFFKLNGRQLPWSSQDPNDTGGVENCVFMRSEKWRDTPCDNEALVICSRPCAFVPPSSSREIDYLAVIIGLVTMLLMALVARYSFILGVLSKNQLPKPDQKGRIKVCVNKADNASL